jgi:bla regulator protein blaR1
MNVRHWLIAGGLSVSVAFRVGAQTPATTERPSFEVASVKPNKTGDGRMMVMNQPGGGLTITNLPVAALIRFAYQLQDFQLIGAPDWIANERFDIVAKSTVDRPATPQTGPPGQTTRLMLQSLIAERFKLAAHPDTRQLPIYELVLARVDGKLGPQLRPSTTDCQALMAAGRGRGGPPPAFGERPACGMMMGLGTLMSGGTPVSQLIGPLSQVVRRVVVDRTDLKGNFDIDLTWTPDQMPSGPPPPGAPPLPAIDPNGPSIFTALQEQLGLKLESQTGPVDVLVIDHVERPTED